MLVGEVFLVQQRHVFAAGTVVYDVYVVGKSSNIGRERVQVTGREIHHHPAPEYVFGQLLGDRQLHPLRDRRIHQGFGFKGLSVDRPLKHFHIFYTKDHELHSFYLGELLKYTHVKASDTAFRRCGRRSCRLIEDVWNGLRRCPDDSDGCTIHWIHQDSSRFTSYSERTLSN